MTDKHLQNTKHLIERALERYGVTLTEDDLFAIGAQIVEGKDARFVRNARLGGETWVVQYKGTRFRVKWDGVALYILTFLPSGEACGGPVSLGKTLRIKREER